jgi:spore coat protein CotH
MKLRKLIVLFSIFSLLMSESSKAQTDGDAFFGMAQVHDVYMSFPQANYWDSLVAYLPLEQYLKADITIDGTVLTNVGIKFKGNSSYSNPSQKKPFKVDLNEFVSGQDLDGLKKFNLNNGFKDPSFMREKLSLDFYNEHGLAAPRCAYARVYLNGVYWGIYTFVEEVNKTFLNDDDRFDNKQGNLFKGDPIGDLKWINSTASSYYTKYELHTNETANDWSDLVNLIDNINNSGSFFHDSLEAAFNTSSFIRHWAAMNVFVNLDSYIGSGHNYFIYDDTLSRKFEWISWDVNESFGNFNMGLSTTQLKNLSMFYVSPPSSSRPLVQKMLLDPDYKNLLVNTICQWMEHDFTNEMLDPKIDSLANAIRNDVYSDTKKFYTNAEFDNNLSADVGMTMGIKSFITERRNWLLSELAASGCNVGINESASARGLLIYPNPAATSITLNFPGGNDSNSILIFNSLGQKVYSGEGRGNSLEINISGFASGLYVVSINNTSFAKFTRQ